MSSPDAPASAKPASIGPPPGNQPPAAIAREEARTLSGLFARRVTRSPHAIAYTQYDPNTDNWDGYTWSRVRDQAARWQAAFDAQGLAPGDRVAILEHNGVDWVAFDQAALASSLVVMSLYPADSAENMAFILKDCGARLLFVGERSAWQPLAGYRPELVELCTIVCRDTIGSQADPNLRPLDDWLPEKAAPLDDRVADPGELATLIYTSGTTGRPKGVMLSHANILSSAHGLLEFVPGYPDDVFISYLPLAHSFERTVGYYLPMIAGCRVAYARSVDHLLEDLQIIRPTIFLGVPRVYERICVGVRHNAEKTGLGRRLLFWTLSLGRRRFETAQGRAKAPGPVANLAGRVLERLVARRVLARLGGRVRVAACGGAPLLTEVSHFLLALGVPLNEAAWREFAVRCGVDPDAAASLVDARINNVVLHRLGRALGAYPRDAQVRAVHLTLEPWTVANGLLTPTMKLRRDRIAKEFADAIRETH